MSKTTTILLVAAAAAGVGFFLYRRGKLTRDALGEESSVADTVKAGALGVWADVRAATPSRKSAEPAGAATPTEAGFDPRVTQRAPTHTRTRLNSILSGRQPASKADEVAQGIAS